MTLGDITSRFKNAHDRRDRYSSVQSHSDRLNCFWLIDSKTYYHESRGLSGDKHVRVMCDGRPYDYENVIILCSATCVDVNEVQLEIDPGERLLCEAILVITRLTSRVSKGDACVSVLERLLKRQSTSSGQGRSSP